MNTKRVVFVVLVSLAGIQCGGSGSGPASASTTLTVAKVLEMPQAFSGKRADYIDRTEKAFARVREFAKAQHLAKEPKMLERVRFVAGKRDFDIVAPQAALGPSGKISPMLMAVVDKGALLAVSEPAYLTTHPGETEIQFEKALSHAIAEQLHRDLAGEDPGATGPVWFQQGFAAVAADQYVGEPLSPVDARALAHDPDGKGAPAYAALVRHLLKKTTVAELVRRAGSSAFSSWIDVLLA